MKFLIAILTITFIFSLSTFCQEDQTAEFLKHEVSLGLGAANSFENSMFNLDEDTKTGTNFALTLDYFYNFDERYAIGISIYGFSKTVNDFWIITSGSPKKVSLDFLALNLSAVGRYTFTRGTVEPYAIAQLSYSSGSLENNDLGKLNLNGVSVGVGGGVGLPLSESFAVTTEVIASFGTAKWKEKPFLNSGNTDYNPSLVAGFVKISYKFN
ncbi:MAG: hypothetical protein HY964_06395 [Ignavibacteriales bacterium]|nr:hypothetical protein [Ignavibacteriales bacterium]